MSRLLIAAYQLFRQYRIALVGLLLLLCVLLAIAASRLHIESDITRAIPGGEQAQQVNEILRSARFSDKLIVRIQLTDSTLDSDILPTVGESLDTMLHGSLQPYIAEVKGKTDEETTLALYQFIRAHLPLYLSDADYRSIDTMITSEGVDRSIARDYHTLNTASGLALKRMIADDPVGISSLALRKLNNLQVNSDFDVKDGFITTSDHRSILFFITPSHPSGETAANAPLLKQLTAWSQAQERAIHGLRIYTYGGTAVSLSNAEQLHHDMILTLSMTIVGLLGLMWFFFRRKRIPFIMLLPVGFGVLFSLGLIGLFHPSISVIALAAGSIVLGIAVNYSLHFFTHYRHCGSITETLRDLWMPMTLGSATTVGALLGLTMVQSPILHDFGLFAGLSLMGAALFTLFFLPQFLPAYIPIVQEEHTILNRIINYQPKRPAIWVIGMLLLTILFATQIKRVRFESDMNTLSYLTPQLREAEAAIHALTGGQSIKTVYIASTGKDVNDALAHNAQLMQLLDSAADKGIVTRAASISSWIPAQSSQQASIAQWNTYWSTDKKQKLIADVNTSSCRYGFSADAFKGFNEWLYVAHTVMPVDSFAVLRNTIGHDWLVQDSHTHAAISSVAVPVANRQKLFALLAHNTSTVILDKQLYTSQLVDVIFADFNHILWMTSLLVFFALLITYGRMELTLITFLPMAISWIWILGIMGMTGLPFNIINIIISTFIFGLGDDFAIFITDGLSTRYQYGRDTLPAHRTAIFLGAATTLLGLGVLVFAQHPALRSIAWISMIGICSVLVIGQILQPILYNFYIQHRRDRGYPPYTLYYLVITMIEFGYFAVASVVISICAFILIRVLPYPNIKSRRYALHWLISKYMWTLSYIPFTIPKIHIGKEGMDFSRPAMIISNHTSYLDILVTVMQHPRLILLTNDWVYHSPIFGSVVRLAEYFPISDGTEEAINRLKDMVADGYSIVVFPEGTRSSDGQIGRFHKGAFYLAERLGLDIVPLLLHGFGDRVRKGSFMLMDDAPVRMKYLPRIAHDDMSYGSTYQERTKAISKYFKKEHTALRIEAEQPIYFAKRLLLNYVYKGPILAWYFRRKIRLDNHYELYHKLLPMQGKITDMGCGYGFMMYMLQFMSHQRELTGVDWNEDKIATAQHCYSKTDRTQFICADVNEYMPTAQDAFVLSDVLHYLDYEEQQVLIKRCADALLPNGQILICAGNESNGKHRLTWLTAFFSVHLGFNKKLHDRLYFTTEERLLAICAMYQLKLEVVAVSGSPSNTLYRITRVG
jgi:uncharacterized protein